MRASYLIAGGGVRGGFDGAAVETAHAPRCTAVSDIREVYINIFAAKRVMGRPPSAAVERSETEG